MQSREMMDKLADVLLEQLNHFHENMMPVEECKKKLKEYAELIDGFVIFGAMQIGIDLKRVLEKNGIPTLCFIDEMMQFGELDGVEVVHSVSATRKYNHICFVLSSDLTGSVKKMRNKVLDVWPDAKFLDRKVISYIKYEKNIKNQNGIYVNTLCIEVTNRCTLRCKGCSVSAPLLPKWLKIDFPSTQIKTALENLSKIIDGINTINVGGGEPLLYDDLDEILKCIRKNFMVGQLVIPTNLTVLPCERVMKAMQECEAIVRGTDYGKYSVRKNEIKRELSERDIKCFIRPASDSLWSDYGDIVDSGGDGSKQMNSCREFKNFNLYNGKLYPCFRLVRIHESNVYEPKDDEYIDLVENFDKKEAGQLLLNMDRRERPFYGCRYCGIQSNTIAAGVQL